MNKPLPDHQRISEHLAVERTFLAWVRTAIAVISLGFVVAKSGIWLRDFAARLNPKQEMQSIGISVHLGIGMIAFGSTILILAAWHCHCVHRAIERGEVRPAQGMVVAVTTGVVLLALLMIVYIVRAAISLERAPNSVRTLDGNGSRHDWLSLAPAIQVNGVNDPASCAWQNGPFEGFVQPFHFVRHVHGRILRENINVSRLARPNSTQ